MKCICRTLMCMQIRMEIEQPRSPATWPAAFIFARRLERHQSQGSCPARVSGEGHTLILSGARKYPQLCKCGHRALELLQEASFLSASHLGPSQVRKINHRAGDDKLRTTSPKRKRKRPAKNRIYAVLSVFKSILNRVLLS